MPLFLVALGVAGLVVWRQFNHKAETAFELVDNQKRPMFPNVATSKLVMQNVDMASVIIRWDPTTGKQNLFGVYLTQQLGQNTLAMLNPNPTSWYYLFYPAVSVQKPIGRSETA